jgi:Na+/phosphate symporter
MQIGDYCVLGTTEMIPEIVDKYRVDIIVFAITEQENSTWQRIMEACQNTDARIIFLPDVVQSIKSKFFNSPEHESTLFSLTRQINNELEDLNKLLDQGQVQAAQIKIRALEENLARTQTAFNS